MDTVELRDGVMAAAGIGFALLALVFLLLNIKLSLTAYRTVRRLERFQERRLAGSVAAADAQLAAWLEAGRWTPKGLWELAQLANKEAKAFQERRRPKPKPRRFFGLLPPA